MVSRSRAILRPGCIFALLGAIAIWLSVTTQSLAQEFRLAPLDQVSLRVLDWNPIEETVRGWVDLSGEYHLDETGHLMIPFVGKVAAEGKTLDEVGTLISQKLRERFALSEAPDATLDFIGVRTLTVGGYVREPGSVAYHPGMTVRHAIALAGGLEDLLNPGTSAFRDYISNQGDLRLALDRQQRQLAVLARLNAERDGAEDISVPAKLANPDGQALIKEQTEIMQRRRARLASEREALGEQTDLLEAEIASLTHKTAALERQRELAEETRETARSLAKRGLVNNDRLIDAENTLISVENQLLDTSTAILRARQAVSSTRRELEVLISGWTSDVIDQIQTVSAESAETLERITTILHLLDDDSAQLALLEGASITNEQVIPDPVVTLYRQGRDGVQAVQSDLDTRVQPRDLVDIGISVPKRAMKRPLPERRSSID
ncbi:polysaccharide biosynthesis/export family protein [Thioclava sp.]|uniref:polysaccharide biosynthesis/export family protein n=1 Tax=Thioclava sp. TaxID=1933450 RepID=UPI003AA7B369